MKICTNVRGILRHGNDPDLPHWQGHDYHEPFRACGTSLTDEKIRQILFRAYKHHPQWGNVDLRDPQAVHEFLWGVSVGKVRFQVLVDQSNLEICLWRAVQGHTVGSASSTPEQRGFQPIEPDVLPRCYRNPKATNLDGPTGILKKGIIPGGYAGHQRGATSCGKDGVFCSPIDPK